MKCKLAAKPKISFQKTLIAALAHSHVLLHSSPWVENYKMLTVALSWYFTGEQRGGRPGPAGDWDPKLSPQTTPPPGHPAAAQGEC